MNACLKCRFLSAEALLGHLVSAVKSSDVCFELVHPSRHVVKFFLGHAGALVGLSSLSACSRKLPSQIIDDNIKCFQMVVGALHLACYRI